VYEYAYEPQGGVHPAGTQGAALEVPVLVTVSLLEKPALVAYTETVAVVL